ncbi:MAG: hypothetical protein ACK4V6_09750 [Microthrixaceae bacterium]
MMRIVNLAHGLIAVLAAYVAMTWVEHVSGSPFLSLVVVAPVFAVLGHVLPDQGVWYLVVLGAIAILAVLVLPKGLWGLLSRNSALQVFPVGYRVNVPHGGEQ